jgi:hypothetical protein
VDLDGESTALSLVETSKQLMLQPNPILKAGGLAGIIVGTGWSVANSILGNADGNSEESEIVPENHQAASAPPPPSGDPDDDGDWGDDETPSDKQTVLSQKDKFSKTGRYKKGAQIYKGKDGKYYHRDTLHKGKSAELEVYNKKGDHVGTANPKTGNINSNKAIPGRNIKKELK